MLEGQAVICIIDQNMQNIVLINNPRTAWPTKLFMSFLIFLDNLLQDAYSIILQNCVDILEIVHKICSILVWGAVWGVLTEK